MSYCDFKVGDEVVCVDDRPSYNGPIPCVLGSVYVVERLDDWPSVDGEVSVYLVGVVSNTGTGGFRASRFRKVQRRDLSQWLSQSTDLDEEQRFPAPKAPAKKREQV